MLAAIISMVRLGRKGSAATHAVKGDCRRGDDDKHQPQSEEASVVFG
jgi:hypothetical protein